MSRITNSMLLNNLNEHIEMDLNMHKNTFSCIEKLENISNDYAKMFTIITNTLNDTTTTLSSISARQDDLERRLRLLESKSTEIDAPCKDEELLEHPIKPLNLKPTFKVEKDGRRKVFLIEDAPLWGVEPGRYVLNTKSRGTDASKKYSKIKTEIENTAPRCVLDENGHLLKNDRKADAYRFKAYFEAGMVERQ